MIADPSSGLTELEAFTTILVAGIYLRTNETLQSDTNATSIKKLIALL